MDELIQDLRHGCRALTRRPGPALVALATLALGIGANTALFSVVNAVLLRPLPYRDPGRLVAAFDHDMKRGERRGPTSPATLLQWTSGNRSLEQVTAAHPWAPVLTGRGEPEQLHGLKASRSLFALLGARPLLGQVFQPLVAGESARPIVVLGHALWTRRFGADPAVVGRALTLDGTPYTVVGVMPAGFRFPPFWATDAELWTPLDLGADAAQNHAEFLRVFARLRPGATVATARAELDAVSRRLAREWPDSNAGIAANLEPLREPVVGPVRTALLTLLGAVGLVLLIACLNIASLLLAQGTSRERELAVRTALGAGRARLLRQWLTESLLLSLIGGALGLLVAYWALPLLVAASPDSLPRVSEIGLDGRVLGFGLALSLGSGILFGVLPALRAGRSDLTASLRGGPRVAGRASHRLHDLLVTAECGLAVVLLVGAGLLLRSFLLLVQPRPGFRTDHLLAVSLSLAGSPYASPERQPIFFRELGERVGRLPGVERAALVNHVPVAGDTWRMSFLAQDHPPERPADVPSAIVRSVSPGYLATMGIPLLRGRDLEASDEADARPVVLVNRALARRIWPGTSGVGERLRLGRLDSARPWLTVVGVFGDARQSSLSEPIQPEILFPYGQNPVAWWTGTTLVVHTGRAPEALVDAVKAQVWAIDPDLPVTAARSMREILSDSVAERRFDALLLGLLALAALGLAAVGVYGLLSYSVSRRAHEIGVRMALGARRRQILALVVGHGLRLAATGAALGLLASLALSRLLTSLLFGISPADPATLLAIPVLLTGVAGLACLVPARRAARVDPLACLRDE